MSWKIIGANLSPGGPRGEVSAAAEALAGRFSACLIGLAAAHPSTAIAGDGYAVGELMALEREALEDSLEAGAKAFHARFDGSDLDAGWRGSVTFGPPAACLAAEARAVDVIVTAPMDQAALGEGARVNIADLVMGAGRPIIIVPVGGRPIGFDTAVIAWKDSREARRALVDALPLLRQMQRIVVLEVRRRGASDDAADGGADVIAWLARHGVAAKRRVEHAVGDELEALREAVADLGADVLIAGAYGRARLREWVLGGVTCDYLLSPDRCVLLSH